MNVIIVDVNAIIMHDLKFYNISYDMVICKCLPACPVVRGLLRETFCCFSVVTSLIQ